MRAIIPARPQRDRYPALHRARGMLVLVLLLVLGACAWLDSQQRRLALRPTPTRPQEAVTLPAAALERWTLDTAQGAQSLALWWLPQPDPQAPALLYLHGTLRNLYGNQPKIAALHEAGFAILAVDYRGWGDSTNIVPSEETIASDSLLAWGELRHRQPVPGRRVIFGHSMGGAVAVRLASSLRHGTDYGALVLESTFTRMADVAAEAGAWGRIGGALTTLDFDSQRRIGQVDAPIVMLHGSADRTVPVTLGRRLRDAAPPGVRWVEFDGGSHSRLHSDAPLLYRDTMRQLMGTLEAAVAVPAATSTP